MKAGRRDQHEPGRRQQRRQEQHGDRQRLHRRGEDQPAQPPGPARHATPQTAAEQRSGSPTSPRSPTRSRPRRRATVDRHDPGRQATTRRTSRSRSTSRAAPSGAERGRTRPRREASAILEQDGFTVTPNSTPAPADQMVQPGTVYNQNPAANQAEPKGTLVQIFVQPQNATATTSPTDTTQPSDATDDATRPRRRPSPTAIADGTPLAACGRALPPDCRLAALARSMRQPQR